MALTKVSYSMIEGAVVNALDFGAGLAAVTSLNANFSAASPSTGFVLR